MDFLDTVFVSKGGFASVFHSSTQSLIRRDRTVPGLFGVNDSGLFINPSMRSSLYQDVSGTNRAMLPGDPIGLIRDLSGRGNHASQAVALNRPVLGRHPSSGLRNRANGAQAVTDNAYWQNGHTSNGTTATRVGSGVEDGVPYVDIRVAGTSTSGEHTIGYPFVNALSVPSVPWTARLTARIIAGSPTSGGGFGSPGIFPRIFEYSGATLVGNTVPPGSDAVSSETDRTVVATRLFGSTATDARMTLILRTGSTEVVDVTYRIKNLQFEQSSTPTALQHNLSPYDVTEPGYGDVWYFGTNGINKWLNVPNVVWGGSDEVTLIAVVASNRTGVQSGVIRGGGNASPTRFGMVKQSNDRMNVNSAGSVTASTTHSTEVSGSAEIYTMRAKIGAPSLELRVNGALSGGTSASQGAGSYLDNDLNIASWGGGQFHLGRFYGLLAINRLLSDAELSRAQPYMARLSGVTIP